MRPIPSPAHLTQRVAALLVALFVLASPAAAQGWSALWRDPEMVNYELTMDKLRKLLETQRAMIALNAREPGLLPKMEQAFAAKAKSGTAPPTVAEAAALIDGYPGIRSTLSSSGMTAREYLLISGAIANAGIELMLRKRSTPSAGRSAAQQANVALLEKNRAEWQQIEKELAQLAVEAMAKKPK